MKHIKLSIIVLAVAVLAMFSGGGGSTVAQAQTSSPFPVNITVSVVDGDNPGDVVLTWNAVPGARYYRVGWVAFSDYQEISVVGGRPWSEAFTFVDIENLGRTSRTIRRLTPGELYAFLVGPSVEKDAAPEPAAWSNWTRFTLAAGPACPAAPPTSTEQPQTVINGDYDADNDGLIEIRNLAQLDAIRYDLDGDGQAERDSDNDAYAAAFPGAADGMGCPAAGCIGYELVADLDYGNELSAQGWEPIGNASTHFNATFDGNDHTIANLYIIRGNTDYIGLFSTTGPDSVIRRIGLTAANVVGKNYVGGLVGFNRGAVSNSHVTGGVTGISAVGGLVGDNLGAIIATYATGAVAGNNAGGLVGGNRGSFTASYASGTVTGTQVGGLAGSNRDGTITASYATGAVTDTGQSSAGGLVGRNFLGSITASYATGTVSGTSAVGGLVGQSPSTISNSYWDTETSGLTTSTGGVGKTTAELQEPTGATGIYATWNPNWWDFGTSSQYPVLKIAGLDVAAQRQ